MNALARTAGDGLQVDLEQVIGTTWASVKKLRTPDLKFQLRTPTTTAIVRGTSFVTTVEVVNGQTVTTVRTAEGEVVVQAVAGCPPVTVGANQQTQVTQNGPRRRRSLSRSGRGCASPGPRRSDSWSVIPADSPAARPA